MAHPSLKVVGKDKRRFARRPTLQTALVRFGEGAAIPCEIRDYCQNGLYVVFLEENTLEATLPSLIGTPVQVEFSVAGPASYRCNGHVARVSPGGIGVFVASMQDDALLALRRASARLAQPRPVRNSAKPSLHQAQALQQECTNLFRSFLKSVMQDFFQGAAERLGQAGQDEPSFLERSRYDYGAQELMQHRSRIEDDFYNAIRDRMQEVGPVSEASRKASADSSLALVEEAEFEDWLNLSSVVQQIEADITLPLGTFEQRYSLLSGIPIDRKSNPFGPEMIGRTFQIAIQGLDFSNSMRTVLYKAFGQAISGQAAALYEQLNQTLVSLQPAEVAKPARTSGSPGSNASPSPSTATTEARGDGSARTKPDLAEIADTLNARYQQSQTGIAQTPERAEYSLDRILAGLDQTPRRLVQAAGSVSAPTLHQNATALQKMQAVRRLQQTARQLTGRDAPLQSGGAPGKDVAALPEIRLHDLLLALDNLPMATQATAGVPSLADQLDARIAAAGGNASQLALTHRRILDTTADLFARARSDVVPRSDIESLVKRLERPLLKLALQDTHFPNMPDHPARQVLDLIEQYAVAADDKGRFFDTKLQRFLYLLIDRVCSQADLDPGIFGKSGSVWPASGPMRRSSSAWPDAKCPPCFCACWMPAGASIWCYLKCARVRRAMLGTRRWPCSTGCPGGLIPHPRLLPARPNRHRRCWVKSSAPWQRSMWTPSCSPHSWKSWAPASWRTGRRDKPRGGR